MAGKKKFERKVFKDLIRDAIYEAIINEELKPGDRIVEMEWAERFSASQAPVREAIRDLEARGIVVSIPFKGSFVREMTEQQIEDVHEIRAGLETVALNQAMGQATEEQIRDLHDHLEEMFEAAKNGDEKFFMESDIKFHETIVDMANTTDLKKLWNMCNIRLWTAVCTKRSEKELQALAECHVPVYEALVNKDSEHAYKTMREHFHNVSQYK